MECVLVFDADLPLSLGEGAGGRGPISKRVWLDHIILLSLKSLSKVCETNVHEFIIARSDIS